MAAIDPRSGYCSATRTFHNVGGPAPPSPPPLSFPAFAFSRLPSPLPSHAALVDAVTGEAVSFPAFLGRVRALEAALRSELSLSHGDVALILAPNSVNLPVLIYALLSIGAVASPVKPTATAGEVSGILELSKPSVAFAAAGTAANLPPALPTVLLDSPEFQGWLRRHEDGDEEVAEAEAVAVVVRQSDAAAIQYSSGTTGHVKAVALPHGTFTWSLALHEPTTRRLPQPQPPPERRCVLQARPIATAMAFVQALVTLALGDTLVVMSSVEEEFRDIMRCVERYQATDLAVGPPVVAAMARGQATGIDVSSLRRVVCGGAALPVPALLEFRERFPGVLLGVGYGSTEGGPVSMKFNHDDSSLLGSAGQLIPGIKVRIVDRVTGDLLSTNQKGELHLCSPYVMKGYVGDENANARAFDYDGWLKTGDLCYINQDGFLYIVDRIKDIMIYNGYEIEPAALEQVLHSIPGTTDAAVIPFPDEVLGDIPTALIVPKQGVNVSKEDIMRYMENQVEPCKRIRDVIFVSSIPRPPSGKTMRRELLKMLKDGHGITVVGDIGLDK